MILSDRQHWILRVAAEQLPPEKLPAFQSRVAGILRHQTAISDDDVADAAAMAKRGLVHSVAEAVPVAVPAPRLANVDHRSRLIPKGRPR